MNQNSLQAYFDESNQRKFNSHKAKIIRELKEIPNQHSYQLANNIILSNEATKKRLTDLLNEGSIEVSGSVEYYGNNVSLYRVKTDHKIDFICKVPFKKWVKDTYPEVLKQYNLLFN